MAAGRVGSAMASELGTMRVSEQIDAIEVMAVNPVGYLVVPRLVASALMTPLLCILFNAMAFIGCYWVAVQQMQIDEGAFLARIRLYLTLEDISHGLYKSFIFGIVIAYVGCYKGYHAHGGAKGVGLATTQTVVICSISVFILDYILTRWLLSHA
jgi:phospholipid/cholesterol/gamma-HCH transport system permease protein